MVWNGRWLYSKVCELKAPLLLTEFGILRKIIADQESAVGKLQSLAELNHYRNFEIYCRDDWLIDMSLRSNLPDGTKVYRDPRRQEFFGPIRACRDNIDSYTIGARNPNSPDMVFLCDHFLRTLKPENQLGVIVGRELETGHSLDQIAQGSLAFILARELMKTSFVGRGMSPYTVYMSFQMNSIDHVC